MLKLHVVMAVAFVAATLGDQLCFYLGRRHGPRLLARFPVLQAQVKRVEPMLAPPSERRDPEPALPLRLAHRRT